MVIGVALGSWISHGYFSHEPTDYEKWKARPKLNPISASIVTVAPPCFFIVSKGAADQPVVSGSVADCLLLMPDGRKLDLFEVRLGSDYVFPIKSDLYLRDAMPLAFTRTYNRIHDWAKRHRICLPHVYDPYLSGNRLPYTYLDWRLPDGQVMHYERISPGMGFADAIYEAAFSNRTFGQSRINWNGWGWDLSFDDGITYLSPEAFNATRPQQGSLVGIFDKDGNEIRLSRESNGNLTEVKSPSGQWFRFRYDNGRMIEAKDSSGDVVRYDYDSHDRPVTVKASTGQATTYSYDLADRIVKVEDSSLGILLENKYDSSGRVIAQATLNGGTYSFRYLVDDIDITDPTGEVIRVTLSSKPEKGKPYYTVKKLGPISARH